MSWHTATGDSVSFTVTSKEQDTAFPLASVTSCVTVVVPTGNSVPLACPAVITVVAPEQLSVPNGVT